MFLRNTLGETQECDRFAEIKARTLIVAHPDDDIHPLASARLLQRSLADCFLVVAPTMTYYRENPEELAAIIEGFLEGDDPSPSPAGR